MGAAKEQFQLYESWNLTKPKSSPRSKLYHLEPIGLGTPRIESLSSYIERLAAAHLLSIRSLFAHVIGPASNKTYLSSQNPTYDAWNSFVPATRALNGIGKTANDSVSVLEGLTLRQLRSLTMLRWRFVLSEKALSRATHAWCPQCYQERRQAGQVIYNQLLWTLVTVEVCPFHQTRLLTACPHCNHQLPILGSTPRLGYCSFCHGWLGNEKEEELNNSDAASFKIWVATQMSELLAATPGMPTDPPSTQVTDFVPQEINNTCNGNVNEFARIVNVNNITVYSWCYDRAVPQNDLILRVCFATNTSYVDLLTGKYSPPASSASRRNVQTLLIPGFRRHKSGEIRRALLSALIADPPLSFREVSDSLGYKSDFLSVRYPELRDRIRRRYRKYQVQHQSDDAECMEPDDQTIESALRKALEAAIPPSIQQLGKELGYPDRYTGRKRFKKKFPDLCKAVSDRRKRYLSNRRENIGRNLERVLQLETPLTLDEAIELLGFKDSNYLRKYYPDLCQAIVERSREYRKAARNGMQDKLRAIFHEQDPISLRAAAARLGKNPAYLGSRFSRACKAISRRYRRHLRERSRQRKKEGATRIRATAFELHAKGIYPSAKTVVKFLNGRQTLTLTEIGDILRKVRRKLKIHSP